MAEAKKETEKKETVKPAAKTGVKTEAKAAPAKAVAAKPAAVKPAEKKVEAPKAAEKKVEVKAAPAVKAAAAPKAEAKTAVKAEAKPAVKAEVKPAAAKKPEVKKVAPVKKEKSEKGKLPYVSTGEIRVELIKSTNGCTIKQIRTVQALGLRKINEVRVHKDNPAIRGMCTIVAHLVKVEKIG